MEPEKTEAAAVSQEGIDKVAAEGDASTTQTQGMSVSPAGSFADEDAELEKLIAQSKAEGDASGAPAKADEGKAAASEAAPAAVQKPAQDSALTRVLIRERKEKQALRDALAIAEGRNQVLTAISRDKLNLTDEQLAAAGLPEPKDERTTEQKINDIDSQLVQLAQDYDDAKLSASEWKKQETALQNQKFILQTETMRAAPVEQATDLGLEEHAAKLVADFPVVAKLTEAQLQPFANLAYEQAAMEGKPIQNGTAVGTKDLRERMARLATDFYGKPGAQATGQQVPKGGQQGLSPEAQARADKLAMAAAHPANIAATGSGAGAGAITDAAALETLNAMGGDEEAQIRWLAANPAFANKVTGGAQAGR